MPKMKKKARPLTMSNYDVYTGILKVFPLPTEKRDTLHCTFNFTHPMYEELKSKYPIVDIAGAGDDFSKTKNLLHWVSNNIYHMSDYAGSIPANAIDYLSHAFKKDASFGINCVALSIILSECLLAIGIKARKVFMMPCSPYDGDNHVVVQAYIKEMKKWVMFDPTLNAVINNEKGEFLSLLELRQHLADQMPIFFNKEAKYNDDEWTEESAKANTEYFAKNLFYFHFSEVSTFNEENHPAGISNHRIINLCPQNYHPKDTVMTNLAYRKRLYGEQPWMKEAVKQINKLQYYFCATTDFEA